MPTDICAIYCGNDDIADIPELIRETFTVDVKIVGPPERWDRLTIPSAFGNLECSCLRYTQGGDKFSRNALSIINYWRSIKTDAVKNQEAIVKKIGKSRLWISVEASLGFSLEAKHIEIIFAMATLTDGYVSTGRDMMSADSRVLLSYDGTYETSLE